MISLKEIINTIEEEKNGGLIPYDEWSISETDYLSDVGFKPNGPFAMGMERPPMMVYRKEDGFHLKDGKNKKHHLFKEFDKLISHFDNYQQDSKTN